MQWVKRLFLLAAAGAVAAAIVSALLPQPVAVDVGVVEPRRLQVTVNEDGITRIREKYVVSTPLAARLMRIGLKVGDAVTAGETILARLQPTDPALLDPREVARAKARVKAAEGRLQQSQAELARAKAALEHAETEMGRLVRLAASNAATQTQADEARLLFRQRTEEYRVARFAEEIARYELELEQAALLRTQSDSADNGDGDFLVRSPITGRVLRLFQESAAVVQAGAPLLEVGDPSDLEIVVDVLSTDAVRIPPGAAVRIEQWGGEMPLAGRVRLVEPSGFTKLSALGVEEQRVNVIVDFLDPIEKRSSLGDGFRIEAQIVIWEGEDVLSIPTSALFRQGNEWACFVAQGRRAERRHVRIGRSNGLLAQVLGGVAKGERVILHPSDAVADGVEIELRRE
jgi:HlyD family secretion protein